MQSIKNFLNTAFDIVKVVVVSAAFIIPIRTFVFQPFFVRGASMVPSFHNGDYLLIDELSYRFNEPQRGDVIVFRYPRDPSQFYIKRIVGLPGERVAIKDGKVSVFSEGKEIDLSESYIAKDYKVEDKEFIAGPDEYIVFGDNRTQSSDSRVWGAVPRKNLIGKVFLTAWPPTAFSVFAPPEY